MVSKPWWKKQHNLSYQKNLWYKHNGINSFLARPQLILQASNMTYFLDTSLSRLSFCRQTPLHSSNPWVTRLSQTLRSCKWMACSNVVSSWWTLHSESSEFLKDHFHIIACLKIINQDWEGFKPTSKFYMTSCPWGKISPWQSIGHLINKV